MVIIEKKFGVSRTKLSVFTEVIGVEGNKIHCVYCTSIVFLRVRRGGVGIRCCGRGSYGDFWWIYGERG